MTLTPLFTEVAGSIPFLRSVMARTGASSLTPDKPDAMAGMLVWGWRPLGLYPDCTTHSLRDTGKAPAPL